MSGRGDLLHQDAETGYGPSPSIFLRANLLQIYEEGVESTIRGPVLKRDVGRPYPKGGPQEWLRENRERRHVE
jgi:hypothetical protein